MSLSSKNKTGTELLILNSPTKLGQTFLNAGATVGSSAKSGTAVDSFNATAGAWVGYKLSRPFHAKFLAKFGCQLVHIDETITTSALTATAYTANPMSFDPLVVASLASYQTEQVWATTGGTVVEYFALKSKDTNPGCVLIQLPVDITIVRVF